jgi:hypothetical protein
VKVERGGPSALQRAHDGGEDIGTRIGGTPARRQRPDSASPPSSRPDGGPLLGAMILGAAGLAWTMWGASGVSGAASGALPIAGIAVGLVILLWSARLWRSAARASGSRPSAPPGKGSRSMASSAGFRLVMALEVIALAGGVAILGGTGNREYMSAWFATVVGLHFAAFGRLFWAGFHWLAAALIAAGVAGAIVGLAGGGVGGISAVSGLTAAASLFAASGWTLARIPRSTSP